MDVIVISLGTYQSAGENLGFTWDHLGAPATRLGGPATSLNVPMTGLGAPATSLGAPRITVEQSGKNIFGMAACAPGNHSYYLLFNDC